MMQRNPAPWFSVLALAAASLVATPSLALAQDDGTPAESAEEAEEAETETATSEDEPAPEDDEDEKAEEEPAETVEEAPVPPPGSAAGAPATAGAAAAGGAAGVAGAPGTPAPRPTDVAEDEDAEAETAAGAAEVGTKKDDDKVNNAAAMGAASPVVTDDAAAKPWLISAGLQTSLGSAAVADQNNDPVVGYSFSATGLYKLAKLWQGRLDGYGFLSFNQNLSDGLTGNALGGTGRNQFFLQDIQLGVLGRGIYTEGTTGIIFGFRSIGRLPTSDLAMAFDRVFRWDNGVTMTKPFSNVGPGTVILSLAGTFRKDFGPKNPSIDVGESPTAVAACATVNQGTAESCFSDLAPLDWAVIGSLGARYLLNNGLGFNFGFSFLYNKNRAIRAGDINGIEGDFIDVNGNEIPVSDGQIDFSSPFANETVNAGRTLLFFTSVSLSYVFNANWSISGGLQTFQNAFVNRGDNNSSPSFPFFANDAETNATTFFLSGSFTY
jgi:hypothetical protein